MLPAMLTQSPQPSSRTAGEQGIHNRGVGQGRGIPQGTLLLGCDLAQHAPHDLAGARLGQACSTRIAQVGPDSGAGSGLGLDAGAGLDAIAGARPWDSGLTERENGSWLVPLTALAGTHLPSAEDLVLVRAAASVQGRQRQTLASPLPRRCRASLKPISASCVHRQQRVRPESGYAVWTSRQRTATAVVSSQPESKQGKLTWTWIHVLAWKL